MDIPEPDFNDPEPAEADDEWPFDEEVDAADPEAVELWLQRVREALAEIEACLLIGEPRQAKDQDVIL